MNQSKLKAKTCRWQKGWKTSTTKSLIGFECMTKQWQMRTTFDPQVKTAKHSIYHVMRCTKSQHFIFWKRNAINSLSVMLAISFVHWANNAAANILTFWFLASMRTKLNEEMCPEFHSELDLCWLDVTYCWLYVSSAHIHLHTFLYFLITILTNWTCPQVAS